MKNNDFGSHVSSLLSIPEYAKLKGFTTQAIYAQINSGRLDHAICMVGNRRYIDLSLVDQRQWPARRSRESDESLDRLLFSDEEEDLTDARPSVVQTGEVKDAENQASALDYSKTKTREFSTLEYEQKIKEEKLLYLSAKREDMELQVKKSRGELILRTQIEELAQEYYAESRQLIEQFPQKLVSRMGLDEASSLLLETASREASRMFLKRMEEALEKKKKKLEKIAGS